MMQARVVMVIVLAACGGAPLAAASIRDAGARFDLHAEATPLFRAKWLQDRRHILQSFAFDDVGGHVYLLQVEGSNAAGTFAEHSRRGDLILTKLTLAGATIAGHMVLRGFGHGVAMGVERDGDEVHLWTEVDSEPNAAGVGRGTKIGRFRFVDGATLDTASREIRKFSPAPGAQVCTPSVDLAHGRIAVRYVSAEGEWRVALYDLSAFKAGDARPLREISLRHRFGTLQGWCTFGEWLYVYAGTAYGDDNPPPGNATLFAIDWRTGDVVGTAQTHALADLVFREPEGLAVQIAAGRPRLCFGFGHSVSATNSRRQASIVYLDRVVSEKEPQLTGFVRPPDATKPAMFWWWFNSHVSRAGITPDWRSFARKESAGGFTSTDVPVKDDARLLPSGLLGPVTILVSAR
ncbi:MAG TPA: hypothetical protein VHF69_10345 [Candidatus Synoicihabitans sp.]|nr:hypothetical protein [Candidatus Synoicihabitans sp.]